MAHKYDETLIEDIIGWIDGLTKSEAIKEISLQLNIKERAARDVYNKYIVNSSYNIKAPKNKSLKVEQEVEDIQSLDDIVRLCKIDTKVWEVESFSTKESSSGGFLWTVYFRHKTGGVDLKQVIKELNQLSPRHKEVKYKKQEGGLLAEVGIFDLHIGKLAHKSETGNDYDIKIASKIFDKALDYKIGYLKKYNVERILFPVGNDFYQVDSEKGETSSGTRQDCDTRFSKMFQAGAKLIIEAIHKLKEIAPVDVFVVVGNHGTITEFLLGEVLVAYFRNDKNVTVQNEPTPRKYYRFGKNLIGLTHGDRIKMNQLPMLMATECPVDWAQTDWRYVKLGHYHHQKIITDDSSNVLTEILPSLSAHDFWHKKSGFSMSNRAAITSLYDKENGLITKIYYNHKES